jgi:hypothetical protein
MAGRLTIRGLPESGEKKDLRFHPNNRRKPDCGLAMETVFAIDQNIRIMSGLMILSMKEQKIIGPFGF